MEIIEFKVSGLELDELLTVLGRELPEGSGYRLDLLFELRVFRVSGLGLVQDLEARNATPLVISNLPRPRV